MMRNDSSITVYLVRHGETVLNSKKIIQGHKDSDLTEKGRKQAQELKSLFKSISIDKIYSSDLKRAITTAEIINDNKATIHSDSRLREKTYGKFEGGSITELKILDDLFKIVPEDKKLTYKPFSDVESDEEVAKRLINFLESLSIAKNNGKTILAVTHSGSIRSLLLYLGWSTYAALPPHAITYAAYIKIDIKDKTIKIVENSGINLI